jgi:hypothetical protein
VTQPGRRGAVGIHVPKRRPRYPDGGAWPFEMRADVLAALLDYPDTNSLIDGILRAEAPRPTVMRGAGARKEPIWSLHAVQAFLQRRHALGPTPGKRNLGQLLSSHISETSSRPGISPAPYDPKSIL